MQAAATALWQANKVSLDARYGGHAADMIGLVPVATSGDVRAALALSPVVVLKVCACFEYQSCEDIDGWPQSEGYALMFRAMRRAIRELPGYDEAPWGLD